MSIVKPTENALRTALPHACRFYESVFRSKSAGLVDAAGRLALSIAWKTLTATRSLPKEDMEALMSGSENDSDDDDEREEEEEFRKVYARRAGNRNPENAWMDVLRMARTLSQYIKFRYSRSRSEELLTAFTCDIDPDIDAVARHMSEAVLLRYLRPRGPTVNALGAGRRPEPKEEKAPPPRRFTLEEMTVGGSRYEGRIVRVGKNGFAVDVGAEVAGILSRSNVGPEVKEDWLVKGAALSNLQVIKIDLEKRHFYLRVEILGSSGTHKAMQETSKNAITARLKAWSKKKDDKPPGSNPPPKSFDDLKVGLEVTGRILRRYRHGVTVDIGCSSPGWLPFDKAWRLEKKALRIGRVLEELLVQELDFGAREFTLAVGATTTIE